jgi:hypothetical protein
MLARRIQRLVRGSSTPNLVVARRVIDKMISAAHQHLEDETGEALVGLFIPAPLPNGVPTLYVLDTISPDASAVRQFHTFQQGDTRQDELIWWLQENWRVQREQTSTSSTLTRLLGSGQKWDVPLRYIGDWHKQPGYMIQPSGGDLMTALDWIDDPENNTDFLLAPIVTLDHPTTIDMEGATVDFWYIDRATRMFMPITPAVYPDDQLPELVAYPWHLNDEKRLETELNALHKDGLYVSSTMTLWNADGKLPLEICLIVGRVGADKLILVVTPHDYPQRPPSLRAAPFGSLPADDDPYKLFERVWANSSPIDLAIDGQLTALLDYVLEAEKKLGIQRPEPPSAQPPASTPDPAQATPTQADAAALGDQDPIKEDSA